MHILILTTGSRGDVQPFVALARQLIADGFQVTLGADPKFESFIADHQVPFARVRGDYYSLMDSPEGQALKSGNPIKIMRHMQSTVYPLMRRLLDDAWDAAQGVDALIYHPKVLGGAHLAEALNIPAVMAATLPLLTPTGEFPMPGVVDGNLGFLNRLTYQAVGAVTAPFQGILGAWRQEKLSLPARSTRVKGITHLDGKPIPVLYCYSSLLVPTPKDWREPVAVTGFWTLPDAPGWQPEAALEAFLKAGSAPVYIGFGSMVDEDPRKLTEMLLEGVARAGVRAVLASGWGGLNVGQVPPNVYLLTEAPHSWLFPRMSAVVHHGGAGTTAAALGAGKPALILPFIADQPFWGSRVEALGVGRRLSRKRLTADQFAEALRLITTDGQMKARAEQLGEQLRAENGPANAAAALKSWLALR